MCARSDHFPYFPSYCCSSRALFKWTKWQVHPRVTSLSLGHYLKFGEEKKFATNETICHLQQTSQQPHCSGQCWCQRNRSLDKLPAGFHLRRLGQTGEPSAAPVNIDFGMCPCRSLSWTDQRHF